MPHLARNDRQIRAAKVLDDKRTRYFIRGVKGLVLDVNPSGVRTWYAHYHARQGTKRLTRWYRIGDAQTIPLSTASDEVKKIITSVEVEKADPQGQRRALAGNAFTFNRLFDEWFERYAAVQLARPDEEKARYQFHLAHRLGHRHPHDIKRVEFGELRDEIAKTRGAAASDSVLTLVNRVFNWGVDEGYLDVNPASRLRKVHTAGPRKRVLSHDEIRAFWNALDHMETMSGEHMARGEPGRMLTPLTRSVLRILLLTGQRRIEVVGAQKSELAIDNESYWTIPVERVKNSLLHRLPLLPMAKAEFLRVLEITHDDNERYIFPSPKRVPFPDAEGHLSANAITRAMTRLCAELGIPRAGPHDLRRTVGTEMAKLGISKEIRSLVLNHAPRSNDITNTVYNRYAYDKEKREALQMWEQRLASILVGETC